MGCSASHGPGPHPHLTPRANEQPEAPIKNGKADHDPHMNVQKEHLDDKPKPTAEISPRVTCVKVPKEDLKAEVTSSEHDVIHVRNDLSTEADLPDLTEIKRPADITCLRSKNNAKWPIRCFCSLDFNVNAGYGGCASLLLLSCSYNKGDNSTTEIFLLRSGFDCNHVEATSLVKSHGGHFGAENRIKTDEDGRLLVDCLFGLNFACLLSNDSRWGHGGVGVVMDGPEEEGETAKLRLNVNGGSGGGTSILMCSGMVPGVDTAKAVSCMYVISSGAGENAFRTKKLFNHGEDLWKFSVDGQGVLQAAGPMSSRYALFHNRDTFVPTPGGQDRGAKVRHTQAYRGDSQTVLLPECRECGMAVVLCSSSSGPETATTASLYVLTIVTQGDQSVEATFAAGSSGKGAPESADQWKFAIANGTLVVEGPPLPCRYAILSNFPEEKPDDPKGRCHQDSCLATRESSPVRGVVSVDGKGIRGWVTAPADVVMKVNERTVAMVKNTDLASVAAGRMAFTRRWAEDETTPGLRLVRVFASKTDQENKKLLIELEGSPFQHVIQPKGILFALNTAGPSYQALNNIVYLSEHRLYHNYDTGPKSKTLGLVKTTSAMPQLLCGTYDGFIYGTARNHTAQTADENRVTYNVPNLPNGNHTITLHYVGGGGHIIINGQKRVNFKPAKTEVSPGYTAHTFSTPVTVSGGSLEFTAYPSYLCGFSICDASYVEPKQSSDDVKREQQERVKLGLEATPLPDSLEKKKMQIAGWSANLLGNASGELGNMSHWNIGGDWKIREGGYGTEKCFVTSHMRCTKYQEVDLTKTFSEEHLDSSPEIQVSEWYTQGVCGGGFYTLEVTLMTYDGDVIKRYKSGERGNLYSGQWHEEKVTFTDYGAGVRLVGIQSSGKDDKHWGGHYGARMSNAFVRVRREANAAEDDKFADIISENVTEEERNQQAALREKVVQKVLTENAELWSQDSNEAQPMEDPLLSMQQGGKQKDSAEHDQERNTTTSKLRRSEKPKQREIRVFVSSTFKDFKGEREYLIKKTFRELNRLCAERSVFFTYVDLRWGITKEQSDDGRTISICLKEVDRCRPYFICMIGERFGWSQKEGEPDKLLNASFDYAIKHNEDLKWIEDHRFDTSVTQLEVQHAALNNPDGGRHRCFFYLRDPVNTDTGTVSPDDVQVFLSESDWHYEHQYKLRKAVLDAGMNVRNYKETEDACTLIMEDLQRCVDEDFPPGTEMTPMQREQEHHMAFADARRRVYIGRQEYFDKIDDFMAKNKSTPLVLVGESGSGKSALVANWVSKHEQAHPDHFVFVHFIGSSAESSNHVTLVRRLMEELKAFFNLTMAVPTSDTNLVRSLPVWLRMAGMMGRVLIVMDALNQLDSGTALVGEGDEHDLLWIPNEMPPGVSVLLSTLPGRAMEAASANGWEAFRVQPLQPEEKSAIIKGYLEDIYTKTLSEEQKQLIIDAPQTNNPLYLKALLDEMRLYGEFETVTTRIQHYLEAENPGVLFGKILERLENDFETGVNTRKDLVRLSTSAIWCSHRGLSEEELVTLLDVPSVVWSPFYLSLDDNLINRNGILNFFHDHLRQAVEARYLPTADDKRLKYLELADYFATREIDDRVVDELPFLLSKAGEMERLRTTITNLQIFQRMMKSVEGTFNLMKCWQQVGGYEQAEVDYLKALAGEPQGSSEQDKEDRVALLRSMAAFFVKAGLLKSARSLYEELLKMLESRYLDTHGAVVYHPRNFSFQHKCKHTDVLDVLHSLGNVCERQMELKRAEEFYTDALDRQTRLDTPKEKLYLVKGLLGLASVKSLKEDQKEAKKLLLRAKEVATSVLGPHHHYVASIVGQIGQVCYKQGRVDEALGFYLQELSKVRAIHGASHPRTAGVLNSIALVYDDKNDERAGEIYETALATMVQAYGNNHVDVAIIRYNLGAFYFATSHYARSKYQFEQAASVFESFLGPDHPDTAEAKEAMDTAAAFVKE
ncbi:TEP1 [Branchiostoma lanceolatum]|uniref:TEP1 protein n=1 Tax=Branchiostoma lanceolatum TaxID=7740 RepID=A0A8J9ZG00_BRALA|nr:TEP1 [Branchiostoma lanceolatum]